MEEKELKNIWKNSSQVEKITFESTQLHNQLQNRMSYLEKAIHKRDRREIAVATLSIPLFVYLIYDIPYLASKIACALSIPWLLYVIFKLRTAQKYKQPIDMVLSFKEQLERQKYYLSRQARLLNTVWYWYALPPFIINIIFIGGLGDPGMQLSSRHIFSEHLPLSFTRKITVILGLGLFYLLIIWLNKRAVKKDIQPTIIEIDNVLKHLKTKS